MSTLQNPSHCAHDDGIMRVHNRIPGTMYEPRQALTEVEPFSRTCNRRSNTRNKLPQTLRVPGSRGKYFRYFMYSQYLAFVYCEILLALRVFQDCVLRILPYSQYFGIGYSGILLYLKYFGVRYSGIHSVLGVWRDYVLHVLWVSAVFRHLVPLILSILGVFQR